MKFPGADGTSIPCQTKDLNFGGTCSKEKRDVSLSLSDDSETDQSEPMIRGFGTGTSSNNMLVPGNTNCLSANQQSAAKEFETDLSVHDDTVTKERNRQPIDRLDSDGSRLSISSSNTSPSDTSIREELKDVATEQSMRSPNYIPSGRLPPLLGRHQTSRNQTSFEASPSTVNHGPSPPTILQARDIVQGIYPHPQPQVVTWMDGTKLATHMGPFPTIFPERTRNDFDNNGRQLMQDTSETLPVPNRWGSNRVRSRTDLSNDQNNEYTFFTSILSRQRSDKSANEENLSTEFQDLGFKVYWQRWLMLFYMSFLNLLSDWTCYSVAPIALLTDEAFGNINPEQLVTIFLIANAIASASEPMILARLGLRRTVLFGSLLLMIGSIVKSGGMPPIIQADLKKGEGEWRVYLGFFIVGLSQPLYQCTPALLSASWFPENERTMATGVALNANQIGIGFAFIFGTILVATSDDIPQYFSLLSILSTLAFLGTLIQFADAPPTPPSQTAKVVRGTLEVNLPSIFETVRNIGQGINNNTKDANEYKSKLYTDVPHDSDFEATFANPDSTIPDIGYQGKFESANRNQHDQRNKKQRSTRRRRRAQESRRNASSSASEHAFHGLPIAEAPSPAHWDGVQQSSGMRPTMRAEPLPLSRDGEDDDDEELIQADVDRPSENLSFSQFGPGFMAPPGYFYHPAQFPMPAYPYMYNPQQMYPAYAYPNWFPPSQSYADFDRRYPQGLHGHGTFPTPPIHYHPYQSYQHATPPPPHLRGYEYAEDFLPPSGVDEGAEPVLTITPHHLDIHIRDDQIVLSLRACLARPGFIHSLVAFTVSGIVINTLSTFMDYLVRLNGAGREYTGIVGGSFQFVIMISSLIVGRLCDKTRAYYSITIGMLVLGAFGLAQCGVCLDADRGGQLRWALVIVAALVGPLQPISTELGVDVAYPLSENTVLVIQQLFSNLLSAAFIPCFKAMRDIGRGTLEDGYSEKPQYTFSFYLLIVLHAICTVFVATFNGRYLRFEHEQERAAEEEHQKAVRASKAGEGAREVMNEKSSLMHSVG